MMRLEWTDNARQERKALVAYIARDDVDTAKRIDDKLQSAAEGLLIFPRKEQAGRIKGTRDLFVPPRYRLIYKLENDRVVICSASYFAEIPRAYLQILAVENNFPAKADSKGIVPPQATHDIVVIFLANTDKVELIP